MKQAPLFALLLLMLQVTACKKHFKLYYDAEADLNSSAGSSIGQPVMVGLFPLSQPPDGLVGAPCDAFTTSASAADLVKDVSVGPQINVSLTPATSDVLKIQRTRGARWLLVVPFWERKCSAEETRWVLLRVSPVTTRRYLSVRASRLELPWAESGSADPRRRQRGCVDGNANHVQWRICE